jgi:hypothetical protein
MFGSMRTVLPCSPAGSAAHRGTSSPVTAAATVPRMATISQLDAIAGALPDAVAGEKDGRRTWSVGRHVFVWERPFRKADLKRFGDQVPPDGTILAVRVADLAEKEAALAEGNAGVFTIPHFDGYARVLVEEAWLAVAPASLGETFLSTRRPRRPRRA